jgi:putative iron-dependent peroxidase
MTQCQSGIRDAVPTQARFVAYALRGDAKRSERVYSVLQELSALPKDASWVLGVGLDVVRTLERTVPHLEAFPVFAEALVPVPSTPQSLWLWLRGEDRGELLHAQRRFDALFEPAFERIEVVESFRFREGRDLSGYVDGTENPPDERFEEVACVTGQGEGLDGSSFVAVQRWVHDLDGFFALSPRERDLTIGRQIDDNEEIEEAPDTAHVKRTAQESFEPEAFMVRRSLPWAQGAEQGLQFVAFGRDFSAFHASLRRMVGAEDGQVDALFRFTRPVTGAYFWCPPERAGRLCLSALGIG